MNLELLKQFYDELIVPNFPMKDQREPLENFLELLEHWENPFYCRTTIFVLIHPEKRKPCGGLAFEYYPLSNFGICTYIVVTEALRGKKLSSTLIRLACEQLRLESRRREIDLSKKLIHTEDLERLQKLANFLNFEQQQQQQQPKSNQIQSSVITEGKEGASVVGLFFSLVKLVEGLISYLKPFQPMLVLETEREDDYDPLMDPKERIKMYRKMGFEIIDFPYYQPNLTKDREPIPLYLMAFLSFGQVDANGGVFLSADSLKTFLWEFSYDTSESFLTKSPKFSSMIETINRNQLRGKIYLLTNKETIHSNRAKL